MKFTKPLWLAIALAGAIGLSGYVWLPVPLSMVEKALAEREPGFRVSGSAHLRWASGELRARGLRLDWSGRPLAQADEVSVRVDLRPWAPSFGQAWRITVKDFSVELEQRGLDALLGLKEEESEAVAIEILAEDGRLAWTLPDGERIAARLASARTIVRTGTALESESAGEALLLLETPATLDVRLRFRAVEGGSFEASAVASGTGLETVFERIPELKGTRGSLSTEARVYFGSGGGAEFQRLRVTAEAAGLGHPKLPIILSRARLEARGDLLHALSWEFNATSPRGDLGLEGLLAREDAARTGIGQWRAEAQAHVENCALDAGLEQQLAEQLPEALEVLEALGLRGSASARAGFRGRISENGVEAGWELAAMAPLQGLGLDYAGFPDEEGEIFSFPYPVAVIGGIAGWTGTTVLVSAEALAGEAGGDPHGEVQEPTRIGARCAVALDTDTTRVWLDLDARAVRLDERIGAALQANAETGALWYELGTPRGTAQVDVALRPLPDGKTAWSVQLRGRHLSAEPPVAGIRLQVPSAHALINAGGVQFTAEANTEIAQLEVRGRVRALAGNANASELAVHLNGSGYLSPAERERLAAQFELPTEFVEIEPGSGLAWTIGARMRLADDRPPPLQLLAELRAREATPSWPQRNASGNGWSVHAAAALTPTATLLVAEPAEGYWRDARLQIGGSARLPAIGSAEDTPWRGTLTASLFESAISQDEVLGALQLLNADTWTSGLRFAGKVSATVELPLADPSALRARLDLNPLNVLVQPGALGATAMTEPTRYMLIGAFRLLDGAVSTPRLVLRSDELDLVLEETGGRLDESGLSIHGVAQSQRGVRLRSQLEVIAPARVLHSLDLIGLDGRIAPRRMNFDLQWPAGGTPRATANGSLVLSDFDVLGPPPVSEGAGSVICDSFVWNGPEDFRGSFRLENGSAVVSGVHLRGAQAKVQLLPDRVMVTEFEARALDGRVFTQLTESDGTPHQGLFSLGLSGNAALRADFAFEGLLLERMGEELGYRGPLAGRLDGRVNLASSDPSPLNYRGNLQLKITNGILGAVPVLSQIWQLLGVDAPVFREGRLALQFLSEGRILVEELALLHPLLEVTGERVITMDSYLGLKVTVRTFGFLGRLPLIRDVLDLIVEQDVYGPANAPKLRQRGIGKLFQGDPERVKFPLWVPRTPLPDRLRSPVLPAERVLPPRP